jgi:membrane protease YdiL (CAAX protease family)
MLPCAVAFAAAIAAGIADWRGVVALLVFGALCAAARRLGPGLTRIATHVLMLLLCAALFVHVVPGFDNPLVVSNAVLGPGAQPYTKYLNFDKGAAALLLLALYAPDLTRRDEGARRAVAFLWRFAVLVGLVIAIASAVGYVRWAPKLPAWWPLWLWSMVFLTALAEEALFRGVVQSALERWLAPSRLATALAIVGAGTLFGVAHVGGGPSYVLLSSIAGIGYGWIYASTRSLAAAIAAHAGLNAVHFFFFTYPALAAATALQ